jgi:alkylhydroperoxidase family enzyme
MARRRSEADMSHIEPVPAAEIPESLKVLWKETNEPGQQMIQALSNAPVHAERFLPFYNGLRYNTILGQKLSEMIRLAVVHVTGCYHCQAARHPTDDNGSSSHTLTEEMALAVADPDSPLFTPREQAVLKLTHAFAITNEPMDPAVFEALHEYFNDEELTEMGMLLATFVGFSRFMATFEVFDTCPLPSPDEIAPPVYSVLI